jgi:hypothetical protein
MNVLLFLPALALGFPLIIGVWLAAVKMFRAVRTQFNGQTAFAVTLCAIAAVLSLMTAPFWLIGVKGYLVVSVVYIGFVAYGSPHVYRVLRFLALELDGNPADQVQLPGDEKNS